MNMKFHPITFFSLLLLTHAAVAADSLPGVIGKVGNIEINAAEVQSTLGGLAERDSAAVAGNPTLLNQVVRSMLVQKLLLKEAQDQKWEQQAAVQAKLERAKETVITESYLQSVAAPPKSYPSQAELQETYDANRAALLIPKQFRLAQIFIANAKGADKATAAKAQAKLDGVLKSLKAKDANFSTIATASSEEANSAGKGGEIGWLTESQIQPEIRSLLPSLKLGVTSEPVKLEDGWHIINVLDVKEPNTPTLDQVKVQLSQQMRAEKTKANSQEYLAKLLQDNPLAINELALSKILQTPAKE